MLHFRLSNWWLNSHYGDFSLSLSEYGDFSLWSSENWDFSLWPSGNGDFGLWPSENGSYFCWRWKRDLLFWSNAAVCVCSLTSNVLAYSCGRRSKGFAWDKLLDLDQLQHGNWGKWQTESRTGLRCLSYTAHHRPRSSRYIPDPLSA